MNKLIRVYLYDIFVYEIHIIYVGNSWNYSAHMIILDACE